MERDISDIQITLEKSEYVKKRADLMKTLKIPNLSDTVTALGPDLAQIVFDECENALKEDFGLIPPLNGAGDELWVSPSDLLIGKVALKPPLTQKHVQALTHQGILKIGRDIEVKFWNEMEMEKERALADQRKRMLEDFQNELSAQLRFVESREQAACQKEMQRMTQEFEARLLQQLDNLEARLRREFMELHKQQEIQLREEFAVTLQKEIELTVLNMTKEFLSELERQETILSKNFKLGLQKSHTQKDFELRLEQSKCKQNLTQLKHNLECKNLANMMYILCMERKRCSDEKTNIENHFNTEIEKLNATVDLKNQEIKLVTEEKNRQIMEVKLRETCLLEIIKEFQKFINFALRASPTQAEFLLSVEKMMAFELTDAILKSKYATTKNHINILPWVFQKANDSQIIGLEIQDHHDCLNEINPPIPPDAVLGPDDFLPAFNYGKNLYVREDFRNMVSQGIRITQSSTLWSRDVEILMETLKQSVSSNQSEDEDGMHYISNRPSKTQTGGSSIQFKFHHDKPQSEVSKRGSREKKSLSRKVRSSMIKPVFETLDTVDFSKIGKIEEAPAILATACSIELMITKRSPKLVGDTRTDVQTSSSLNYSLENSENTESNLETRHSVKHSEDSIRIIKRNTPQHMDDVSVVHKVLEADSKQSSPKGSLVLGTRDSIILLKSSQAKKYTEFNASPNDSIEVRKDSMCELKNKSSKLVTTKNSLEILRESKMRLKDSIVKCLRNTSSKFKNTEIPCSTSVKETICEKCVKAKEETTKTVDDVDPESRGRKQSITVSHVDIIDLNDSIETNVAFSIPPIVYDTGSTTYSTDLSEVYKSEEPCKATVKKWKPPKDKFLTLQPEIKVLGDMHAKEGSQPTDQFTMDRIKSFIALMRDNPRLIRTFTACTR